MASELLFHKILILDGEQRSTLAAVRSLGAKGIRVIVGSISGKSLAGRSRYCYREIRYRNPFDHTQEFCLDLLNAVEKESIDWLLPMTDASMDAVLEHRRWFEKKVHIPCESNRKYHQASDKNYLTKLALSLGISVPFSHFFSHADDIQSWREEIPFPVVLKPSASIVSINGRRYKTSVKIVDNRQELLEVVNDDVAFQRPFMLQEKVPGHGAGLFALCQNGEAVAVFTHRRLREKPPWGGVSVLCESAAPDPAMKASALALLKALSWNGVAMVEFKYDPNTGKHYLMEINARFWGSLQLAIDAGIDFPYLLLQIYNGAEIKENIEPKFARMRWLLGDLDSCYLTIKRSDKQIPSLKKSHIIFEFFNEFTKGSKFQNLRWNDPGPFLFECLLYIKQLIGG